MSNYMEKISACRACESPSLKQFFDLGHQPLANLLLQNANELEEKYPLSLSWCQNCELVQLNETIDPNLLFKNYPWVTGTSKTAKDFSEVFCKQAMKQSGKASPFVLEIASNDGTFLTPFIEKGCRVLGIDPAKNIVDTAVKSGVPTLCEFFDANTSEKILKENGPADIVIARNVLYHLANLHDVIKGIKNDMAEDGILIAEFHYAGEILKELHYDSIYHEHVCYYTLKTFENLLKQFGLHAFNVDISPINSGGLIVYVGKTQREESEALRALRKEEETHRVNEFESWKEFSIKAIGHREKLVGILETITQNGGSVVGYGASARSSTLLNFCHINSQQIPVIADKNPLKQKKYTAGSHILIESPEIVMARNPSYIFILAWNFSDEITSYLNESFGFNGKYIIPLPQSPRLEMASKPQT